MNINIDEEKCIGCGNCMETCPAVFYLNKQKGKAEIIDMDACDFAICCEAAALNCPVDAIILKD